MSLNLTRLLLLAVVSAMCSMVLGCAPQEPSEVPEKLVGVWITDDPRYEGRFLKLEPRKIHFGLGGDQATENPIIDVEELPGEGNTIYRIKYLSPEGLEYSQSLYYDPSNEEIRYKSRPSVVWRRADIEIKPTDSAQSVV
jgi:hypothetical protein